MKSKQIYNSKAWITVCVTRINTEGGKNTIFKNAKKVKEVPCNDYKYGCDRKGPGWKIKEEIRRRAAMEMVETRLGPRKKLERNAKFLFFLDENYVTSE